MASGKKALKALLEGLGDAVSSTGTDYVKSKSNLMNQLTMLKVADVMRASRAMTPFERESLDLRKQSAGRGELQDLLRQDKFDYQKEQDLLTREDQAKTTKTLSVDPRAIATDKPGWQWGQDYTDAELLQQIADAYPELSESQRKAVLATVKSSKKDARALSFQVPKYGGVAQPASKQQKFKAGDIREKDGIRYKRSSDGKWRPVD